MRNFTLFLATFLMGAGVLQAQTVATFEALPLAHADTFYTNYTAPGTDVGFDNGLAHFPCVYDTASWGDFWDHGFAYSNMTDSVTSGFGNQYAAKTGIGHAGSEKYLVCWGAENMVKLTGAAMGHPVQGFRITNSTYAYNSMRDGDMFAKKFHNGDWFRVIARGYYNGVLKTDSVGFYLANFLMPDSNDNYIVNKWEWFDLTPLGKVDSIVLKLSSTDNGAWGMNTPAYFCMDHFTTWETFDTSTPPTIVATHGAADVIKVYPVPANNTLYVDLPEGKPAEQITIVSMSGSVVATYNSVQQHNEINTATLPAGTYVLHVTGDGRQASMRFVKQ